MAGVVVGMLGDAPPTEASFGTFTMHTSDGLNLGLRDVNDAGDAGSVSGLLDEISVYDRALTENEIRAIVNAGAAGKCRP